MDRKSISRNVKNTQIQNLASKIKFLPEYEQIFNQKVYFDSKKHLISAERLPFTSSYICSMLFTLYAALGIKSYLLTIVAAGVQCVALTYFTLSYIPGGQTAIKFMAKMFYAIFSRCFKSITNVWSSDWRNHKCIIWVLPYLVQLIPISVSTFSYFNPRWWCYLYFFRFFENDTKKSERFILVIELLIEF